MFSTLVVIIQNQRTGRFHPFHFTEAPMPGGPEAEVNQAVVRWRSRGNHTLGFEDRAAAVANAKELIAVFKVDRDIVEDLDTPEVLTWEENEVPATHILRDRQGPGPRPLFSVPPPRPLRSCRRRRGFGTAAAVSSSSACSSGRRRRLAEAAPSRSSRSTVTRRPRGRWCSPGAPSAPLLAIG